MNHKIFTAEFTRLCDFFEPPAHSPNFAKALFKALSVRLNDQEFQAATEALVETFIPTYSHTFPVVADFMSVHRGQKGDPPRNTDTSETDEEIQRRDTAFQREVERVNSLPQDIQDEILKKVTAEVGDTLRKMGILGKTVDHPEAWGVSPQIRKATLNYHRVRVYLRDYQDKANDAS